MKLDKLCNKQDEYMTPRYAIKPLLKYLDDFKTIWCPFDTSESRYVELLSTNHKVIHSHISEGADFFKISPPDCDCIISNPPYSLKTQVFERLFKLNKPFAMLVGVVGLFESQARFNMFKDNKFELMYFNKRVSYLRSYQDEKPALNPPFSSVYVCHNILPKQIVFEVIDKGDL